ncbi:MAG: DASS family sodium-coupled anion symporter [Chitinophagaceae bacterium]|nr:DASS family sodium-coupled anion symporter [Chitinophagaceae bacterium]MBK7678668.1 DASS family sodium-coupled anion symporter [Chitinophagaceae bacterium]MBK8299982.1 DASS family sodium-coupled anion symporter [Chitinophagaceae bacterium]MBK9464026.1 DASS family sodium-coupled anion symporter [Chitinophagaceae bacterium]MBK9658854.1 DASS family sodium-coupled anion symporter [Chitinophagaceae bacterium]
MTKQQLKFISLLAGIAVSLLLYFVNPFGVSPAAAKVLAIAGLMITWWITEALPMPVVALLPLVLFPLLKISSIKATGAFYGNEVIFLFMGGFMLGLAIEKWNLHRRIALNIVRLTGTSGDRIILGFILATGLLSMWLSNTATTMMMFPIALSVIHVMKENNKGEGSIRNFSLTIMLAIAYAANIGGIATIIGTPPNVAYKGYIKEAYNYEIGFVDWMLLCTPIAILLLATLYWVMVKWLFPNRIKSDDGTRQLIQSEVNQLGPLSTAEKRVLIIFIVTALLWILRKIINDAQNWFELDDTMIAVMCAVALFICPAGANEEKNDSLLEWGDTSKMAWGILLLFGGGIALAGALEKAGLMEQLGQWLSQFSGNGFILVLVIVFVSMFISEVMSNVAQVIVFAPVVSSLADALHMNPLLLGIPMTLAASCAGMLPMGTPPNAIVFASGHIKLRQMAKAGFVMNMIAVILITLFCWFLLPLLLKM